MLSLCSYLLSYFPRGVLSSGHVQKEREPRAREEGPEVLVLPASLPLSATNVPSEEACLNVWSTGNWGNEEEPLNHSVTSLFLCPLLLEKASLLTHLHPLWECLELVSLSPLSISSLPSLQEQLWPWPPGRAFLARFHRNLVGCAVQKWEGRPREKGTKPQGRPQMKEHGYREKMGFCFIQRWTLILGGEIRGRKRLLDSACIVCPDASCEEAELCSSGTK